MKTFSVQNGVFQVRWKEKSPLVELWTRRDLGFIVGTGKDSDKSGNLIAETLVDTFTLPDFPPGCDEEASQTIFMYGALITMLEQVDQLVASVNIPLGVQGN